MYLSMGNVLRNPHVGLLFVDFVAQKRLRLNGVASIDDDDPLLAELPGGAVRRAGARDRGVPELPALHPQAAARRAVALRAARRVRPTPVPDWKRRAWSQDALPAADPARDAPPLD